MTIRALSAFFALSAMTTVALAQTAAPSMSTPAPGAMSTDNMANAGGLKMANTATMAVRFMTVKPVDTMSSKLMGMDVYNNQNEKLGEVDDLVIDNGKTVSGLVVGVGGFLGMGESYVVLDPATVVLNMKDGEMRAYIDTNKDTLKNAPKFQYSKKKV